MRFRVFHDNFGCCDIATPTAVTNGSFLKPHSLFSSFPLFTELPDICATCYTGRGNTARVLYCLRSQLVLLHLFYAGRLELKPDLFRYFNSTPIR